MDDFFEHSISKIRIFDNIYPFISHLHCEPELFYLLDGEVEIVINQKKYLLRKNDFVCVFPFCLHEFKILTDDAVCLRAHILIPRNDLIENYTPLFNAYIPEQPVIRREELHPDVPFALTRAVEAFHNQEDLSIISAYLQVVFARVIPQLDLKKLSAKHGGMLIQDVLRYINQHYTEPLTLEQVADAFYVCRSHLSNLFSNKVKLSFNDFLNSLRINKAQALLAETQKPITDILYECGFVSARSFNRNFLKFVNMTPSEYRKTSRNV